jgi:hypothetical protein
MSKEPTNARKLFGDIAPILRRLPTKSCSVTFGRTQSYRRGIGVW